MVLGISYCVSRVLFSTNTQSHGIVIPCYCLTIARDDNSMGPVCALKGAMHPVHQNLKFKESCLVIYQMKYCDHVHHVLHLKL